MTSGIYKITNTVNGRIYVGSASYLDKRWSKHKADLRNNRHHNPKLQAAWNKYGESKFQFDVLELVPDKDSLTKHEQKWLDSLKPWYNHLQLAGTSLGCKRSAATIAKMSERMRGTKMPDEVRAKLSASKTGVKLSEAHKEAIGAAHRGKKRSPQAVANIVAAIKRRGPMTSEQKKKLSAVNKGKVLSEATKMKIAESMRRLRAEQRKSKG